MLAVPEYGCASRGELDVLATALNEIAFFDMVVACALCFDKFYSSYACLRCVRMGFVD